MKTGRGHARRGPVLLENKERFNVLNDNLLLCLVLARIAACVLIGVILLFYFIFFATEVLYISHAIQHVTPFFQAHNKEIEDALKEFQVVQPK